MEEFLQNADRKKVIIITIGFLVIIGVLMTVAFQSAVQTARNSERNNPKQEVDEARQQVPKTEEDLPSFNNQPATKDYLSDLFAFTYPGNWNITTARIVSGGETISVTPEKIGNTINTRVFTISYYPSQAVHNQKMEILNTSGYSRGTIQVKDKTYTRIIGSSALFDEKNTPVQETHLFTSHQNMYIEILYMYPGTTFNPQDENIFIGIINSMVYF